MAHSDELFDEVTAASHRRNSSAGEIEIFAGRERCGGFVEGAAAHVWADSDATGLTLAEGMRPAG